MTKFVTSSVSGCVCQRTCTCKHTLRPCKSSTLSTAAIRVVNRRMHTHTNMHAYIMYMCARIYVYNTKLSTAAIHVVNRRWPVSAHPQPRRRQRTSDPQTHERESARSRTHTPNHTHTCTHIHTCMHISYTCIYVYLGAHVHSHVHAHIRHVQYSGVSLCVLYLSSYVSLYLSSYVFLYLSSCASSYTHTHTHTHTHMTRAG